MSKINNVIGLEVRRRLMDIEDLKNLSAEAQERALSAEEMARLAELLSKSTKEELDQIVIEGDSSVEAAQARVDAEGEPHKTLKARLDYEYDKTSAELEEQAKQTNEDFYDRGVNVKFLGLKGDGKTDDTDAFNQAILNHDNLLFPSGTYLVDPLEIETIPSNSVLHFNAGAILKAINTNHTHYEIVRIHDAENVTITGFLTVVGDRHENQSETGEWGHGFSIRGSKDIYIENPIAKNCWGDGFYIGASNNKNYSENVSIINPKTDNNRRQGLSLVSGKSIRITNPRFLNTNGTSPESGIDIEPNSPDEFLQDIVFEDVYTEGNEQAGLHIYLNAFSGSENTIDIKVKGLTSYKDNIGIRLSKSGAVEGSILIDQPTISKSKGSAISSRDYSEDGARIDIIKPLIKNCNQVVRGQPLYDSGIVIFREDENTIVGNIHVIEPTIIDDRENKKTERAIYVHTQFTNNISIIDPIRLDADRSMLYLNGENIKVTDKNEILLMDMRNYNPTIENANYLITYTTRGNTDAKRVSIRDSVRIGRIFEVIVLNNYLTMITPPSDTRILLPGIETGQTIKNGITGSRIKLKKIGNKSWAVLEMIGNWEPHNP